jgi:tetratricopeptide (TPR) repeat protein
MMANNKITKYAQSTFNIIAGTLTNSLSPIDSLSPKISPSKTASENVDLVQCGIEYKKSSNFELALRCFNSAIAINNSDERAFTELGLLYIKYRYFNNAEINFNLALSVNQNNITSITGISYIHRERNNFEKSLKYYNQALEIDPFDNSALIGRIILHLKMKNIKAVMKDEETLMHSKPSIAIESIQTSRKISSPSYMEDWENIIHPRSSNDIETTNETSSSSPIKNPPLILRKPIKKYLVPISRESSSQDDSSHSDSSIELNDFTISSPKANFKI